MNYQPEWTGTKTSGEAIRTSTDRYLAIADYLPRTKRLRVLDLGANRGYFSLRIADEFSADVVAVDGLPQLKQTLEAIDHPRVTGIYRHADVQLLEELGHFDVILALSVLHHLPWWPLALGIMHRSCDLLFAEVPDQAETDVAMSGQTGPIVEEILRLGGEEIIRTPGFDAAHTRPMFLIRGADAPVS